MTEITQPQAEALARFLLTLRPDWSLMYVIPAIEKMRFIDPDVERITRAAIRGALSKQAGRYIMAKPDPLAMTGEHWRARLDEIGDGGQASAIDCTRCGVTHDPHVDCKAEGWTRSKPAKAERIHDLLEATRKEIQAIEKCSHKVPLAHCKEHRQAASTGATT